MPALYEEDVNRLLKIAAGVAIRSTRCIRGAAALGIVNERTGDLLRRRLCKYDTLPGTTPRDDPAVAAT